ncbi:hypothetical protein [Caballeronia sordidicola]|uniref:Uncharacterized protein n=1 Tax=Caballeronia sordidicola TaxID=196367 RepID=A0A242N4J4_CABSO|nr:hypothetical protein [Caballeronia sordidicola]OTP78483.1 hypothetical protein PAMC26577_04790 [Caballeronia sordidicola]
MFEDTVLRFSDNERQHQLAEQERALAERRANLEARQKNLAFRQEWLKKDPQEVAHTIEREDKQRAEDKQLGAHAKALKSRFGLKDGELIDTTAMLGALEQALAEKEVEQATRAEEIADRASLLAGLNKLALIDTKKTSEILHANKDLSVPRQWSRQEVADLFSKAQSRIDDKGAKRTYPKTLDGWASSLAERHRELELSEIKLDAQEQALRAQVRRAIEAPERSKSVEQPQIGEENAAVEQTVVVADRSVLMNEGTATAVDKGKATTIDTSLETLKDPAKFAASVAQVAKTTGVSAEQATATLENLRQLKESHAANAVALAPVDKQAIEGARSAFFARASRGSAAGKASASVEAVTPKAASQRPAVPAEKTNVIDLDSTKRTPNAASVERGSAALSSAATRAPAVTPAQAPDKPAVERVVGFKTLGRNKTRAAAENDVPGPQTATAGLDKVTKGAKEARAPRVESSKIESSKPGRAEAGPRRKFADLNAHERIERRAEFFGNLRETAGFSRDGKQAVSEKAKEAVRPGKQREGHGVG